MPSTSLVFDLIGRDHVSAPMNKAATSMERTAASAKKSESAIGGLMGSARRAVPQLALLGGGLALVSAAIDIGKDAAKFQQSMLLIQTNANASATEVKHMTDAVLKLSPQVATGPLDLANALYHVEQNGLRGKDALEALKVGAQGAKIGMADVEDTTNTMTIALASGIHGISNMQRAMGFMIATAGTGDMRLKDLNEALSTGILAVAKGFGGTMQDVAAILATLGDNGIRTTDAASALRQTMMGFAAPAAKGKAALDSIGLSMTDLRDEMQKHGVVAAMNDLEQHMKAAGVTGSKVGGFITDAFGRKAGAGISVLMGEIDRVNTKFTEAEKGAAGFGSKWNATTKTTAFAFQRLGAEFESAGIKLMQTIGPAAGDAANWLGVKLPAAISTVAHIVGPLAEQVGSVLGGAWHIVAGAVSVAASGLSTIGGVLQHNRALVTGVGAAVLSMWAAYKAYRIGAAALTAIDLALGRVAMRMNRMGGAMAGIQGGIRNLSTSAVAGGAALGVVGLAMYAFSAAQSADAEISTRHAQEIDNLTQSIEQDNGALGKNTRETIKNLLVKGDLFRQGAALGITQRELTDSLLGNASAQAIVNAKSSVGSVEAVLFRFRLKALGYEVKTATQNAKDKAAADDKGSVSAKAHAAATKIIASASKQAADAEKKAADAAKRLDNALQALSGNLGAQQALDQYKQGILQLKGNLDKTNHSLIGNSAAAVANRLAVDNVVQSALQYAQALKQQGKTQPQINSALQKQVKYLVDNAAKLGLNKKELRSYLRELHLTPKQIHTAMGIDTNDARQKLRALQDWFKSLTWNAHVTSDGGVNVGTTGSKAKASATGGYITGPGTGTSDSIPALLSNGEYVINARQTAKHRPLLNAINKGVRGFSGGGAVGNKPTYSYGGQQYASKRAADNARARDAQQASADQATAIGDVRTAMRGLIVVAKTFSSTGADLKDAAKQLREAARAGKVSADVLAKFSREQHRLTRLGNRRDRIRERLGTAPTAPTAYDRLATAKDNYNNARSSVSSAVGAFDVTTAGATQYGEPVTAGGILAQIKKTAAKAKRFVSLLRKLIKEGLPRQLVEQLAQAGPQAYDQAAALASSTPAQMREIRAAYRSITDSGNAAGRLVANHYYKAGVDSAQALVNGLKSKESALTAAIKRLAEKMVRQLRHSLDMHSPSRVLYNEARLAFSGYENGIHSKHGDIARAASRIGSASVPGRSGRFGSGGDVHHHYNIDSPELHVHYPLEGDLQEGVKQLARMLPQQIRAQSQGLDR